MPVVLQFRTSTLETCNLTTCANTKHIINLLIPIGSLPSDGVCGSLINLTISLRPQPFNPVRFRKGYPPHGFHPIRYIVRWAPHLFISAKVACHPRVLIGTYQVRTRRCNILPNNYLCSIVLQLTISIMGLTAKSNTPDLCDSTKHSKVEIMNCC